MLRLENIQDSFKSVRVKTKAFFQGDKWKEVLVFLLFVLLALGFWLLSAADGNVVATMDTTKPSHPQ